MDTKRLVKRLVLAAGVGVLTLGPASALSAQVLRGAASKHMAIDSMPYVKAHNIVTNGDAEAGRAMVDSLFALNKENTPEYAEGLYWRARVAQSAESAQRDYVRIIVDYSMSPRVPNALLNVGQIELVRGERDKALRYFERLRRDYPGHSLQGLAAYWSARTLFEVNDLQRACQVNAEALELVKSGNVELKNRIEFQNQRCRGVIIATQDSGAGRRGTVGTAVPVIAEARPPADEQKETPPARDTRPTNVPSPSETPAQGTGQGTTGAQGGVYTVQLGALGTRKKADELVLKLKAAGYAARVIEEDNLFKVRVGKFAGRSDAVMVLEELKAKNYDGFISRE